MTDNLELARIAEHRAERRRVESERRGQIRRRRIVALGTPLAGAGVVATLISVAFGGEGAESPAEGPVQAAAPPPEGSLGAQLALRSATNSGLAADAPVPILMYHVISAPPADAPLPELFVDPDDFRKQVTYLAEQGFTAITLEQLFAAWLHGAPAPVAPIEGATTTEPGLATAAAPFEPPRIRIDGSDGVDGLATKLEAAIEEGSA